MARFSVWCFSVLVFCSACASSSPDGPTTGTPPPATPPLSQPVTITFGGLTADGASITNYSESGLTISTSPSWTVFANYGNPAPSLVFYANAGSTVAGELRISGRAFTFRSVDLYSSTTPIPYALAGSRGGAQAFQSAGELPTFSGGTLPNTFGNFRTVQNASATTQIDSLTISLTNPAAPCCRNPMGVDNVVLLPPQ